jgi:acetylornithine deacetylase/succinyl-diaminopimelate desuccinylase-like protein
VQHILRDALNAENSRWKGSRAAGAQLTLHIDTIGIRPTGAQADTAPIIQTALAAAKALGFTSATSASSTDANIPISLGIPAMRIGGGGGAEGAHSLGEWYEDGPNGYLGPQWALLIVAALAGTRQ